MLPEEEIKNLKNNADIVEVIGQVIDLTRKGKYYEGLCCFHDDRTVGSFKVDPRKQTYRCYSCMAKSGDVLEFLTKIGKTFKSAVEILKGNEELGGQLLSLVPRTHVELAEFEYVNMSRPIDPENFIHAKFGKPANTYTYFNYDQTVAGYVLRYYDSEGNKVILPYNYGKCVTPGWEYEYKGQGKGAYYEAGHVMPKYLGFGGIKPVYGLEKFFNRKANIIVVEGEKAADYLQSKFNPKQVTVVAWQGGTGTVQLVDWKPLAGRRVFLWPDNDEVSKKAFTYIAEELKRLEHPQQPRLHLVEFPENDYPKGFDIADTVWSAQQITEFIKANTVYI